MRNLFNIRVVSVHCPFDGHSASVCLKRSTMHGKGGGSFFAHTIYMYACTLRADGQ